MISHDMNQEQIRTLQEIANRCRPQFFALSTRFMVQGINAGFDKEVMAGAFSQWVIFQLVKVFMAANNLSTDDISNDEVYDISEQQQIELVATLDEVFKKIFEKRAADN